MGKINGRYVAFSPSDDSSKRFGSEADARKFWGRRGAGGLILSHPRAASVPRRRGPAFDVKLASGGRVKTVRDGLIRATHAESRDSGAHCFSLPALFSFACLYLPFVSLTGCAETACDIVWSSDGTDANLWGRSCDRAAETGGRGHVLCGSTRLRSLLRHVR